MAIAEAFVAELRQEAATTRRVLERVPEDLMSWKPHEKSPSLGQLAWHIASLPAPSPTWRRRPTTPMAAGVSVTMALT